MEPRPGERTLKPGWCTLILVVALAAAVALTVALYRGSFNSVVPVTLTSDRAGLVMEPGGKVMLNGIQVGQVADVRGGSDGVDLKLDIAADQIKYIPANVGAQIRATTAFGSKFVDLVYPDDPSAKRLAAGAVLRSRNVTTEVNTVFQNLVGLLDQVDSSKLNAVLTTLSDGFRGQGERIGEAITDGNQLLLQLNPRSEAIRQDWQALKGVSDAYGGAADDIVRILDAASTTSATIAGHATALDSLLLSTIGFADTGINVLGSNKQNFIDAINTLEPTTALLLKYDPEITCTLVGAYNGLPDFLASTGGNGYSEITDSAILLGDDPYQYPDNLPMVKAKGGPGGKPGCGSLPDVTKMFPVRQLITNTGFGTGLDWRPNPGIGHPCWVDYLPATRAVPQPPSIRKCLPGPAPGPVTAPGMPPYGAALYGPGGVPLWPGIPPAGTPPPVPVPGTPVAPGKIPPDQAPAVFSAPPPPVAPAAPDSATPTP
ncbi:virulence factor [Mycolicibacterium anyangense]|uniref:Virulence factor n=1 Tax=Mycolicibacterium anyangense TaxID=1431246 RepID=A0A6N4WF80_9MYCO|nr:MCE family protein [Mycolicibacterium anyangense]BBZ77841.1 virulence factor [Mycolicibacterium anyangense]